MRITNSMLANSARNHIGNAKNRFYKYQEQYTTGHKIQRPSDDPTVAVRSLKLRTTYSQLTQYVEKNVKDAMSWMDVTESSMAEIQKILTNMKGYLDQGNCDDLELDQRNAILSTLQQYVKSIFEDNANADYSGRYVFTGYRTDTSLLFPEATTDFEYKITQNFDFNSFRDVTSVLGGAQYAPNTSAQGYVDSQAETETAYRLQLAYDNCAEKMTGFDDGIKITLTYENGTSVDLTGPNGLTPKLSTDPGARDVGPDDVVYLYDTGEILIGEEVYSTIQENKASITVEYCKSEFEKSDIRPEMYFKSECYNTVTKRTTNYADPAGQKINYEINFSQTMTVNTQARDAISTDIYRSIDYIAQTMSYVDDVERRLSECEKLIANTPEGKDLEALKALKTTLEDEKQLRVKVMAEAFGMALTMVDDAEAKLNVAYADHGARYNRTELTSDKLLDTRNDTEERLSNNEGVDLEDVYINLTQANNLYNASLSVTSSILGNTLLNYI